MNRKSLLACSSKGPRSPRVLEDNKFNNWVSKRILKLKQGEESTERTRPKVWRTSNIYHAMIPQRAAVTNQGKEWSTITIPGRWPCGGWLWSTRTKGGSAILTAPPVTIRPAATVIPTICFRRRRSSSGSGCRFTSLASVSGNISPWVCNGSCCSRCRFQRSSRRLSGLKNWFGWSAQQCFLPLPLFFFKLPLSLPLFFTNLS